MRPTTRRVRLSLTANKELPMPELDEIKKDLNDAAIGGAAAKQNLLRTLGLPVGAKLNVERLSAGIKLVIELPDK